jgi:HPt (histidine-containing phosphotransfer) domain-containing protein
MDKTMVLDLSEALSRADGDHAFFLALAELFLQESPKDAAAARVALGRQDGAGLAAAAHKLKGSVIEICAPRLSSRA